MASVKKNTMSGYTFTLFLLCYSGAGRPINLSLKKSATQSSVIIPFYSADKAVDGIKKNGNDKYSQCAYTGKSKVTWWQVDLRKNYLVTGIIITKREADNGLQNLTVAVHNVDPSNKTSDLGTLCCIREERVVESQIKLECEHFAEGRYLRITKQASKTAPLILCEVEVYGYSPIMSFMESIFHKDQKKTMLHPFKILPTTMVFDCATKCLQMPECDKFEYECLTDQKRVCKLGGIFTETSLVHNAPTMYYEALTT